MFVYCPECGKAEFFNREEVAQIAELHKKVDIVIQCEKCNSQFALVPTTNAL